ncbi:cystatin-like [Apteryx mantelli]|uniref:Cystatin-like n=1 Tax=Apteryx mantelli TaxID=2696672 RepID=A0ABM4E7R2_9AVES|nr:cystatin-like [Apteryx rowi]XP_025913887.1 cystatin-like [Apteryx rowi]
MAAAAGGASHSAAMKAAHRWLVAAIAAVLLAGAVLGSEERPRLVGAPIDVADNDEGLQRALRFAMAQYNRASNDKYSSRVARIISAKRQIVAGIKYIMEVEIGRTNCAKSVADVQSCAFHDAPEMAKRVTCKFVVYTVPWLNQIRLLTNTCQ